MTSRQFRIKSAVILAALASLAWLISGSGVEAQNGGGLSPQEKRGKLIYLKGESASGEIIAILGSGDLELPASSFPCSNCHGLKGEGSREGGLQPPPLEWSKLSSAGQSTVTRQDRPPYDETTLARAITQGLNSKGGKLHPGMPHYKMTGEQMSDLIAYLKKIGKEIDADPGLSESAIRVGAALPMTGPLARIGEDVKLALEAYFTETNKQGGIYGRKFELVVADSRGEATGTSAATKQLIEQENVFALVGSFEPSGCEATNDYLRQREAPLIGPVTLSPLQPPVPNPYVFYLLPSFADQSRSLVDFVSANPERAAKRIAIAHSNNELDKDAVAGVKSQAKVYSMEITAEYGFDAGRLQPDAAVKSLAEKNPDFVFFFGSAEEFTAFAAAMDRAKMNAGLLSSAIMAGRAAFNLPPSVAAKTFLTYPASIPNRDDFGEFLSVMQKSNVPLRSVAFQTVAFASAKIFVEAARISSRQLSRVDLVKALEQLRNFETGVIAPVTFGPNRRTGATGSYIVKIDSEKKQYLPVGDRVAPRGASQ
jgi:ABC-type branched-subunit amino acid transport system substrate-binding protein